MGKRSVYVEEKKIQPRVQAWRYRTDAPTGCQLRSGCPGLGIGGNVLTRWVREAESTGRQAFGGTGNPRDEEVAQLKRELARVKKERDFLREAATFFAKESS